MNPHTDVEHSARLIRDHLPLVEAQRRVALAEGVENPVIFLLDLHDRMGRTVYRAAARRCRPDGGQMPEFPEARGAPGEWVALVALSHRGACQLVDVMGYPDLATLMRDKPTRSTLFRVVCVFDSSLCCHWVDLRYDFN